MERESFNTLKLYSANKSAWLSLFIEPIGAGKDAGNDKAYIVFPMSAEVQELLKDYYCQNNIVSKFIRKYSEIRIMMRDVC